MKIGIVDYGASNIGSLFSALKDLEIDPLIISQKADFNRVSKLILPGVGSFPFGMRNLIDKNLDVCIQNEVIKGKELIGICLGMQLLASVGKEHQITNGLDLIGGQILKLPYESNLRIPHIGWEQIHSTDDEILGYYYFAHSYYFDIYNKDNIVNHFKWGNMQIAATIKKENIVGFQFHPEKSGAVGLQALREALK